MTQFKPGLKSFEDMFKASEEREKEKNIMHREKIGSRRIVHATDPDADSGIICDTFLRFKGLQRPAVIVTDLRLVSSLYKKRMHMAISRTQSLLRIVGGESEIRKDPMLANFV